MWQSNSREDSHLGYVAVCLNLSGKAGDTASRGLGFILGIQEKHHKGKEKLKRHGVFEISSRSISRM